ncbi:mutS protein homolog 5-like [Lineus longissimus]|uniref:mutS protein homolog 5-like n=1 Tax=Lineus longissimus TaxID=88925 RepID=UPI002B4C9DCC
MATSTSFNSSDFPSSTERIMSSASARSRPAANTSDSFSDQEGVASSTSVWSRPTADTSDSFSDRGRHATSSSAWSQPADTSDSLSDRDVSVKRAKKNVQFSDVEEEAQIFMSAVWSGGKLGVAYYNLDTTLMYMMLDTEETDDFQLLHRVKYQIQPSCIIVSSKQDERFLKALKDIEQDNISTSDVASVCEFIQLLPSMDFNIDVCKRRILSMGLPSIPSHYTESERTLHLSSLIPLENVNMVRAIGALLKYLDKKRVGIELEDANACIPILGLQVFSWQDIVIMDENSFSALQIFQREVHPSVYKSNTSNSSKEGLSLFGIMNRCKSVIGSKMMKLWFMRPIRNPVLLAERLDAVEFFANSRNIEMTNSLHNCLKHIKNVPRILTRMRKAQASVGDWQALYKTAYNAVYIGDIARAQPNGVAIFKKIADAFTEDLNKIASLINKIVDFEESAMQNRFVVKPNVDPELDQKKRTYNGLPDFMTQVAKSELEKLSDDVEECNVIYLPQLGYLLVIPKPDHYQTDEDLKIPGLNFMFLSNNVCHYKSESTKELDTLLGDTQCDITDQETSIMHQLQDTILEYSTVFLSVMDYAAQLDCLLSLATCAKEFNYVRPEFTQDDSLEIKGGRHPLQELCCSPFVPNDTMSGVDHGKMKVLTGPNASGKSVYLKQVALIVYLAHIGSYVPAESAKIGLIDQIFTRIRTMESVSVGLSTFMIDLNQVSTALRCATKNSLVILDEFGKGTEAVDGLALMAACLRHWLQDGVGCPHTFVSTHFHGLVQQQLLPRSDQVRYQMMEVLQDHDDLVFLYQLITGHANFSYASHVAAEAGLPKEIICRGKEVSKLMRRGKAVNRVDSASTETQFKRCSAITTRFMELDLEKDDLYSFLNDFVLPTSQGIV